MPRTSPLQSTPTPRTVAVTGGARGIGRATAQAFLERGDRVVIGDVDADVAHRTSEQLGALGEVHPLPVDVRDAASFATFLDDAERLAGPLDALVNNAGIMPTGAFLDEGAAMTERMIDVNLRGVIHGTRLAGERFAARRRGHIVNIASLAGVGSYPGVATYCGTKHAVVGFSAAVRRELAPQGVRVTTVLPGVVRTELSAGSKVPDWAAALTTVDPEDVAAAIVSCLDRDRERVTVPARLGVVLTTMGLLPARTRDWVERATHLDRAFLVTDDPRRRAYHERLEGQER